MREYQTAGQALASAQAPADEALQALLEVVQDLSNGAISRAAAAKLAPRLIAATVAALAKQLELLAHEAESHAHEFGTAALAEFRRELRKLRAQVRPEQ